MAGRSDEGDVFDQRPFGRVAKGDVLELHPSAHHRRRYGRERLSGLLRRIEEIEDALRRCGAGLQAAGHGGDLGERPSELARILDESLDRTETQRAGGDPEGADHCHEHIVQIPDEHHRRQDHAGDELGGQAGSVELLVLRIEAEGNLTLASEGPEELVPGKGLLDAVIELPGVGPLSHEVSLRALCDALRHVHREGCRHKRNAREQWGDHKHQRRHCNHRKQRVQKLAKRLLEALRDVADVVGEAAQEIATRLQVEVLEGQPVYLVLHLGAELEHHGLHDVIEHVHLGPQKQV